ncbi:MAG: hypothetical protein HDP34_03870 [Clostridia bacterium]|nr:hypothetical protein [Clostridia bacterium]
MKKLVTIIVCEKYDGEDNSPSEEIEFLYTDEDRQSGFIIKNAVKQAKGKYVCLVDENFGHQETQGFINVLGSASADMIVFDGGCCFKTSIIKGLDLSDDCDRETAEIFAALACKSVAKTAVKPFNVAKTAVTYSESVENNLLTAVTEFKKDKQKLEKGVYSAAFDLICNKLILYYASAIYAAYKKQLDREQIKAFDAKLKENIVLYLALEKRFTCAKLKALRKNGFKITIFNAPKFKKLLNIK